MSHAARAAVLLRDGGGPGDLPSGRAAVAAAPGPGGNRLPAGPAGTVATFEDTLRPTSIAGRVLVALSGPTLRRDLKKRATKLKALLEAA